MAKPENVLIQWPISCFDRRRENPLPVDTWWYVLDESRASDEEKQALLALIAKNRPQRDQLEDRPTATFTTIAVGKKGDGRAPLQYRHLFRRSSIEEILDIQKAMSASSGSIRFESVAIEGDYFETEDEEEITLLEMADHMNGGPCVIFGMPESVTRLGPSEMGNRDLWTVDVANTFAQFFQVVDHISLSQWYATPLELSIIDGQGVVSSDFPKPGNVFGILALLRQLYSTDSKDNLVNRACSKYMSLTADKLRKAWIKRGKKAFNEQIRSRPPLLPDGMDWSTEELLSAFLYGAGLVHARGKDKSNHDSLKQALENYPREQLVLAFHSSMRYLVSTARKLYPVIKQDYLYWTEELGMPKHDCIDIAELLSSD